MNNDKDSDVKNFYYVNGSHYEIKMGDNSSVRIYGNGNNAMEFEDNKTQTVEANNVQYGTPSDVFNTDKAKEYFAKLRKANYLDENDCPTELSWAKRGVLASELAQRLDIENVWVEFEKRWKMDKVALRSGFNSGIKQSSMIDFIEKIKNLLN